MQLLVTFDHFSARTLDRVIPIVELTDELIFKSLTALEVPEVFILAKLAGLAYFEIEFRFSSKTLRKEPS